MASNVIHALAAMLPLCAAPLLPATVGAQAIRPGSLLVYYGYPSAINSASSVAQAATEFGRYDYVAWGGGLENPAHPDHANAAAVRLMAANDGWVRCVGRRIVSLGQFGEHDLGGCVAAAG